MELKEVSEGLRGLRYSLLVGTLLVGVLGSAPAGAEAIRSEVRTVNGQREVVYTNSANDDYLRSMRRQGGMTTIKGQDYPRYQPRSSAAKKAAKTQDRGGRRPDGTMEFAPPQYQVYQPSAGRSFSDNWAFDSFDAAGRQPRLVSYYGWDPHDPQQKQATWVEVDINPLILKYGKIWGVDPLLIEIIIRHESNFNPTAVSPVGAMGLMQLMPETAAGLGVVDAFDVEQNIAGGTRYIAGQLERFNSVPLALAAYNAGPGAVLEYGGVPPYAETLYYVDTIYGAYLEGKRRREGR